MKLLGDVMPGRALLCAVPLVDQPQHVATIGPENPSITCFRRFGFSKPSDYVNGTFDPDSTDVDPFGWRWQHSRVVPIKVLRQVITKLIAKGED